MRLPRLGRLGTEAVDERLEMRALGLLALMAGLLLMQLLGTLALEGAVVAVVEGALPLVEMQGVRGNRIQKLAIMRDHHQHTGVAAQPLLQPQHGIQIQVVGGLVQQQQVGGCHQGARQIQAHAPATRKFGNCTRVRVGRKPETVHKLAGARPGIVGVQGLDLLVGRGSGMMITVGLGLFGGKHGRRSLLVAHEHVIQGRLRQGGRLLGHRGQANIGGQVDAACIAVQFTLDGREEAGLAATVASHHGQLPSGMDGCIKTGKKQSWPASQAQIAKGNQSAGPYRTSTIS